MRHTFARMALAVRVARETDIHRFHASNGKAHCSVTAQTLKRMGLGIPAGIAHMLFEGEHPEYIVAASLAIAQQGE